MIQSDRVSVACGNVAEIKFVIVLFIYCNLLFGGPGAEVTTGVEAIKTKITRTY